MSRLIRVVLRKNSTGKTVETAKLLTALTGDVVRLERTLNATISVEDPTLTDEEIKLLCKNFPHLLPARQVAPAPPPPVIEEEVVSMKLPQMNMDEIKSPFEIKGNGVVGVLEQEETSLRAMLDEAGVKHGRVKKIEKLREMVAELS